MTVDELWFARMDCNETANVQPQNEGKYKDEATIYAQEITKRRVVYDETNQGCNSSSAMNSKGSEQ